MRKNQKQSRKKHYDHLLCLEWLGWQWTSYLPRQKFDVHCELTKYYWLVILQGGHWRIQQPYTPVDMKNWTVIYACWHENLPNVSARTVCSGGCSGVQWICRPPGQTGVWHLVNRGPCPPSHCPGKTNHRKGDPVLLLGCKIAKIPLDISIGSINGRLALPSVCRIWEQAAFLNNQHNLFSLSSLHYDQALSVWLFMIGQLLIAWPTAAIVSVKAVIFQGGLEWA